MIKFYVSDTVFNKLPNAYFGLISVKKINNKVKDSNIEKFLNDNIIICENYFEDRKVKEEPRIVIYRDAFQKININPNKYMCSIEALLTRIAKKKSLPHINNIVDLGNAFSLKYFLPIGAHDLDTMKNNEFCIRLATSDDTFIPFGETEKEKVDENEVVYATGSEIRTRRWIYRQSEIGKITEETTNLLFIIDGFEEHKDNIQNCLNELNKFLNCNMQVETKIGYIYKDQTEFLTD